jgi:serine/threonine protein kinase
MYNSTNQNKLSEQLIITQHKLGNGAFGCVYMAKSEGKDIAIKCEFKKSPVLTLLREFKICRKIYMVKKYLKYLEYLNKLLSQSNQSNQSNQPNQSNQIEEINKIKQLIENLESNPIIKVYNYITNNNMLLVPPELNINYLLKTKCVPETYSYIECDDFNFLTMDLCGANFENLVEKYKFAEQTKYFIAHKLLHILSCIHRVGIIHRDIKLSNFVLNDKISSSNHENNLGLYPMIIDMGLSKEYYKYEPDKVIQVPQVNTKSITGTLRYISLNIHEYKSPTIVDDLISLCYTLIVIFTGKNLPWVGHQKDVDKFDIDSHTLSNCKCGYHKNFEKNDTKKNNTIAELKFHTPLNILVGEKYNFLIKWIKYLYSLKPKQLPSYNYLYKCLSDESKQFNSLCFRLEKK